jgi:DNA replication protein DnaC
LFDSQAEKKIQSALLNIIDYRHSELLSTIITTNLTPSEFKKYVGERCFDRLKASCFFVNISSDKSRRESK